MADGAWYFYAYPFCSELVKAARAGFDVNSIGSVLPSIRSLVPSAGASFLSSVLLVRFALSPRFLSFRHSAPSLVSACGAMSYCGHWLLAFLARVM